MKAELADGRVLEFPDGTAPDIVQAAVKRVIGQSQPPIASPRNPFDPTEIPPGSNFVGTQNTPEMAASDSRMVQEGRGIVHGLTDLPVGGAQLLMHGLAGVGAISPETLKTQDEFTRNREKEYQAATPQGSGIGRAIGNLGWAPAMAGTGLLSSAATGAVAGSLNPVTDGSNSFAAEKAKQIGLGSLFGLGSNVGGRVLSGASQGAKAIAEPFYAKGQDLVLGRMLNEAAGNDAGNVIQRAAAGPDLRPLPPGVQGPLNEVIPGYSPSLAEVAQSPGISGLSLAAKSTIPGVKDTLARQHYGNVGKQVGMLDEMAGSPGERDFHVANRQQVAGEMYDTAYADRPGDTQKIRALVNDLMQRPAFVLALKGAQTKAANEGIALKPENTVQVADYAKRALDDQIGDTTGDEQRVLMGVKDKLNELLTNKDFSPNYGPAREMFAQNSKPINQMDIAKYLRNKLVPPLMDYSPGDITRITPNQYAAALRNPEQTTKAATGYKSKSLEDVMTPDQNLTINTIAKQLGSSATAEDMAKTVGSTTVQNLSGQNILKRALGPLGLPAQFLDSPVMRTVAAPAKWIYGHAAEPAMQERLAAILRDPSIGAAVMKAAQQGDQSLIQYLRAGGTSLNDRR